MLSWCLGRPLGHAAARKRVRGPMDTQAWLAGTLRHYCSVVEVAIPADEFIRSVSFAVGGTLRWRYDISVVLRGRGSCVQSIRSVKLR
jgi:hypothetical protein